MTEDEDTHRMFQQQAFTSNYAHIDQPYQPGDDGRHKLAEHVNDAMTISEIRRDVFATAAMHAILTQPDGGDRPYDFVAQSAYRMADAMERARKVKSPLDVAMDQGSET